MASAQMDDVMAQAMAITQAQAGVRAMSAEEIVAYAVEVARGIHALVEGEATVPQAPEGGSSPIMDPKKSIRENAVICLECGHKFKMLTRRHLSQHGLTPRQYREKYGFKKNASLACRSIQKMRRDKMKEMRLWERKKQTVEEAAE